MNKYSLLSFEFVLGTLTKEERQFFKSKLKDDPYLLGHLQFWEQQFIALNDINAILQPRPQTWTRIEQEVIVGLSSSDLPQAHLGSLTRIFCIWFNLMAVKCPIKRKRSMNLA
ncbi:hypothetical protein ACU6U9_02130 [Pseudomonas sp. HK3]|jgi:anti-sigma-K factor RskA